MAEESGWRCPARRRTEIAASNFKPNWVPLRDPAEIKQRKPKVFHEDEMQCPSMVCQEACIGERSCLRAQLRQSEDALAKQEKKFADSLAECKEREKKRTMENKTLADLLESLLNENRELEKENRELWIRVRAGKLVVKRWLEWFDERKRNFEHLEKTGEPHPKSKGCSQWRRE